MEIKENLEISDVDYAHDVLFCVLNPEFCTELPFDSCLDAESMKTEINNVLSDLYNSGDLLLLWSLRRVDIGIFQNLETVVNHAVEIFISLKNRADNSSFSNFFKYRYVENRAAGGDFEVGTTVGLFDTTDSRGEPVVGVNWRDRRNLPLERRCTNSYGDFGRIGILMDYSCAPPEVLAEVMRRVFRKGDSLKDVYEMIGSSYGEVIPQNWEKAMLLAFGVVESLNIKGKPMFVPRSVDFEVEYNNIVFRLEEGTKVVVTGSRMEFCNELVDVEYLEGGIFKQAVLRKSESLKDLKEMKRGVVENKVPGDERLSEVYYDFLNAMGENDIFLAKKIFRKNDSIDSVRSILLAALDHVYEFDTGNSVTGRDCAVSREKRGILNHMEHFLGDVFH